MKSLAVKLLMMIILFAFCFALLGQSTVLAGNKKILQGQTGKRSMNSPYGETTAQVIEAHNAYTVVLGSRVEMQAKAQTPMTFQSSNQRIAAVTAHGIITGKAYGSTKILIKAASNDFYEAAEKEVTVTVVPKAVTGFKMVSVDYNKIGISWTKIDGVTGYQVYRSTNENGTFRKVFERTGARYHSFTDTGLVAGTTYYYKVRARKAVNRKYVYGPFSCCISVRPVPVKGTVLSVKNTSPGTATAKWVKQPGVSGYEIYSALKGETYRFQKRIGGASNTTFTDSGLVRGNIYYYKVRAYKTVNGKRVYGALSYGKYAKVSR